MDFTVIVLDEHKKKSGVRNVNSRALKTLLRLGLWQLANSSETVLNVTFYTDYQRCLLEKRVEFQRFNNLKNVINYSCIIKTNYI